MRQIVRKRVAMLGGIRAIYSFERSRFHETLTNCPPVFHCLIKSHFRIETVDRHLNCVQIVGIRVKCNVLQCF